MRKQKLREYKLLPNSHTANRITVEETMPWADQTNSFYLLDQWLANYSSLTKSSLNVKWKWKSLNQFNSVTVVSDCLRPMNCSMPGLPVHHQLLEFTQTHVHQVSDAIQLSHPLSSPSPPARNPSQHQSLFQWVNSSHELAKVLEFQL